MKHRNIETSKRIESTKPKSKSKPNNDTIYFPMMFPPNYNNTNWITTTTAFLNVVFSVALLLLFATTTTSAGKYPIDTKCDNGRLNFVSYHIHVLFWQTNKGHTKGALELRTKFMKEFNLFRDTDTDNNNNNNEVRCTISGGNPAPEQLHVCAFGINLQPRGPWLTAQYSFFVPKEYLQRTSQWILQHRGIYDVMIHPNTGCETYDHKKWATWAGTQWEIDDSIFSCDSPMCGVTPAVLSSTASDNDDKDNEGEGEEDNDNKNYHGITKQRSSSSSSSNPQHQHKLYLRIAAAAGQEEEEVQAY